MEYRFARIEDCPAITEFVGTSEYFMAVDPTQLGGNWLLALEDGTIRGTLWFFHEAPHIFLDYWQATSGMVAVKLGLLLQEWARDNKVRYVHGTIYEDNYPALRLGAHGLNIGMGGPYYRIFKDLGHGNEENRTSDDHTAAVGTGG
jgi:hypothetical protein